MKNIFAKTLKIIILLWALILFIFLINSFFNTFLSFFPVCKRTGLIATPASCNCVGVEIKEHAFSLWIEKLKGTFEGYDTVCVGKIKNYYCKIETENHNWNTVECENPFSY